jgi:hypothetical protein
METVPSLPLRQLRELDARVEVRPGVLWIGKFADRRWELVGGGMSAIWETVMRGRGSWGIFECRATVKQGSRQYKSKLDVNIRTEVTCVL